MRAIDSPVRWMHFTRHGAINERQRLFYPIYDWRKQRLVDAIRGAGILLPPDYHLFGRSFDGLTASFLLPIREHYPRDYARILRWFPLAELEVMRYEQTN